MRSKQFGFIGVCAALACLIWASACSMGSHSRNDFYRPYAGKGERTYEKEGIASWYGRPFHGRLTASGERYSMHHMTAAHRSLPFGAMLKVTNLKNDKEIIVKVNDRGPFIKGRLIDLSKKAAEELEFKGQGIAKVKIEWIDDPSDHPNLLAQAETNENKVEPSIKPPSDAIGQLIAGP